MRFDLRRASRDAPPRPATRSGEAVVDASYGINISGGPTAGGLRQTGTGAAGLAAARAGDGELGTGVIARTLADQAAPSP